MECRAPPSNANGNGTGPGEVEFAVMLNGIDVAQKSAMNFIYTYKASPEVTDVSPPVGPYDGGMARARTHSDFSTIFPLYCRSPRKSVDKQEESARNLRLEQKIQSTSDT